MTTQLKLSGAGGVDGVFVAHDGGTIDCVEE